MIRLLEECKREDWGFRSTSKDEDFKGESSETFVDVRGKQCGKM